MVEQERINQQPDNKHGNSRNRPQNRRARLRAWIRVRRRWVRIRRWQIARWVTVIVLVIGGLVIASRYVSGDTDPIQFVTGNLLNALIFAAIVAQVMIYRKQRDIMRHQWRAMTDGLQRTDWVIEKMQGQLEEMKLQKEHMQTQSEAMISQLGVMKDALKANRDSVDLAWEGLKTEKRAYLGTNRMNIDLTARKRLAIYIVNIGKNPATCVTANLQVVISTPVDWHEKQHENVRNLAVGDEKYEFNLTAIYPDSIPVRIGFPLGNHFTDEELALVVQKKSRLTVNLALDYHDGFDDSFSHFDLTYRGKDSRGYDSWGIFPTDAEKEYDQTNPDQ